MAVYGYARVSTQEQVAGTSIDDQVARIRSSAQIAGLGEPEIFSDLGVSGSMDFDLRPAGGRLLDALKKGDTVIAMKMDRMFRDSLDAQRVSRDMQKKGVRLILKDVGEDPVNQGYTAEAFFGIMAVFAQMERKRICERITSGQRAKAARGGYTGGHVPYGYRVEGQGKAARLVEVPEEQEVVKRVHELLDRGLSLRATADVVGLDWNAVRRLKDRRNKGVEA